MAEWDVRNGRGLSQVVRVGIAAGIVALALSVYTLVDVLLSREVPRPVKLGWALVALLPFVGPFLWIQYGRPGGNPFRKGGGRTPPPRPRGPDDDPDFLRGL